jgi:MFS family permease
LVWSIYASMFLEGLFFTALGPLLPTIKAELDLSISQAGVLAAGYVAGALIGAVPAALASARLVGVKTCAVTGVALVAGGTLAFGLCGTFAELLASQLCAGVGAACIWIGGGPWLLDISRPGERGAVLGAAFGVAAVGEIIGPVLGGAAATVGRTVTFTCIAGVALFVCAAITRVDPPARGAQPLGARASAASNGVRTAVWLTFVPNVAWGVLVVLGTLELSRLGASPTAIAVTFVIAAAVGVVQGPLVGHWSDRHGRLLPIRLGLLMLIPALVALSWAENRWAMALLVIFALTAIRLTIVPTAALLTDACQNAGGSDVLALALSLPASAAGLAVGSATSGALAQAIGSSSTYIVFAAGLFVVLLLLSRGTGEVTVAEDERARSRMAP